MIKKHPLHSGEVATIVAIFSMAFILVTTITSTLISKKPQTTATKAAEKTCTASANLTCSQICGGYNNYAGSQEVLGALRRCKCKGNCAYSIQTLPPTGAGSGGGGGGDICYSTKKGGTCGSSYTRCSDCEKVCGIGQCESCKLGSTTKWQCIRSGSGSGVNLPSCSKPKTYANKENCEKENPGASCTQCTLNGAVRYEAGGSGPKQCAIGETICGNQCCRSNQECRGGKCVDKCQQLEACNNSGLVKKYIYQSGSSYFLDPNCQGTSYSSADKARNACNQTVSLTNTPVPSPTNPIPLPSEVRCSVGDCYYKANIFTYTCPSGKETTGQKCYMNFGGGDGWQWGNCCVQKMQPTPLPTREDRRCQGPYTCLEICNSWGYRFSRESNKKVYKSAAYEVVYQDYNCSVNEYYQCSCTNKLNEAQTGIVSQGFIAPVQLTQEDCYTMEVAGGQQVCVSLQQK